MQTADALTEAAAALGIEKKPDAGERVGECQPPIKFNGTDAVIQQGVSYFQALMRYQVNTKRHSKSIKNQWADAVMQQGMS
jgi:hypothetical protein